MDDDAGPATDALLGFQADDEGDYIVRVTAFSSGETGAYRLRISDALTPPSLVPPEPEPMPDLEAEAPEATPPQPAPDHPHAQ
jgi:hypothetical protein